MINRFYNTFDGQENAYRNQGGQMKRKNIPNGLSVLRMLLCAGIVLSSLFGEVFSMLTMIMYVIAGVTDMIDGPLARRIKDGRSELGATLDSIADLLMIIVGIAVFIPAMGLWRFIGMLYIALISFKIIVPSLIGVIKYKEFISLHTYTYKILVGFMFSIPVFFFVLREISVAAELLLNIYSLVIIIAAYLFVVEEIVIILATNRPCRDIKSIFHVKKFNKREGGEKIGIKNVRT